MFSFAYKSEEELMKEAEENRILLNEGEADFVILAAELKKSKGGVDMLQLTIKAYDSEQQEGRVLDNIINTAAWKISQLCKSIGKEGLYKQSKFDPAELKGEGGKAILKHENYQGKTYAKISEYLIPENKQENKSQEKFDDDIPF